MSEINLTNSSNTSDNDSDISQSKEKKTDSIEERGCLNYISVPSLESIAITKIVVELCRQPYVRNAILHKRFDDVKESLSKALVDLLPNILKNKASNIIQPIAMQVFDWYFINDYVITSGICRKEIDYICWTMEGTIDKRKTLELILSNQILENMCIYYAACICCAEDHIASLWEKSNQKSYRDELFYTKSIYESYKYHLIAYWTCFAKHELPKLLSMIKPSDDADLYDCNHSLNKNMFTLSVSEGNVLAAKYFWNKLTEEEISDNLTIWTERVINSRKTSSTYQETNEYTEILCFLLSQMNDKQQQRKIFQEYSEVILKALFFDWRWRKFLLPTVQIMWDFLDGKVYGNLLSTVLLQEIKEGKNLMFVKELWYNSPEHLKNCFIEHYGADLCRDWLYDDNFQSVEIFLDLFFTSPDQIDKLKNFLNYFLLLKNKLMTLNNCV